MEEMQDKDWKKTLTPMQYNVLREKGTEPAFSGPHLDVHEDGSFNCAGCGQKLFSSESKFDSGTGWPSFADAKGKVNLVEDRSHGMIRTEVVCANCKGHLGHLFDDGPTKSGKRFCINGCALDFKKKKE
jgi:peptide-methionine (R)-S-oxide reductase